MNRCAVATGGVAVLLCATVAFGQTADNGTGAKLTVTGPRPLPSLAPAAQLTVPPPPKREPAVAPGARITVRDAVRIALANHPDISTSVAAVQSASGALHQQQSSLGPQVTVSATQQHSRTMRIWGTSTSFTSMVVVEAFPALAQNPHSHYGIGWLGR